MCENVFTFDELTKNKEQILTCVGLYQLVKLIKKSEAKSQ